jgi:NCS1 family nucleobase:cation symporter-1
MVALVAGILPNVPGFLSTTGVVREVPLVFSVLYNNSWFVGFFLGAVVYWILTKMQNPKTEKRRTIDM